MQVALNDAVVETVPGVELTRWSNALEFRFVRSRKEKVMGFVLSVLVMALVLGLRALLYAWKGYVYDDENYNIAAEVLLILALLLGVLLGIFWLVMGSLVRIDEEAVTSITTICGHQLHKKIVPVRDIAGLYCVAKQARNWKLYEVHVFRRTKPPTTIATSASPNIIYFIEHHIHRFFLDTNIHINRGVPPRRGSLLAASSHPRPVNLV